MKSAFRLLTGFAVMAALSGATAIAGTAPAQAQFGFDDDDDVRPRVERRIIERRVIRSGHDDDDDGEIILRRRPPRVIERRYEGPIYGRPVYGRPARTCRIVVTRRINQFGERVLVKRRVCRSHDRTRCWLPERHLCG